MIIFEWDDAKAKSNERKHGVTFEDAIRVFDDPFAFFREDHTAGGELRWQAIGIVSGRAVLLVVHTAKTSSDDQSEIIRIISARVATRKEQALYGENRAQDFG